MIKTIKTRCNGRCGKTCFAYLTAISLQYNLESYRLESFQLVQQFKRSLQSPLCLYFCVLPKTAPCGVNKRCIMLQTVCLCAKMSSFTSAVDPNYCLGSRLKPSCSKRRDSASHQSMPLKILELSLNNTPLLTPNFF